jgi:D-sedoheptulose 7-phosphate isomerase
MTCEPFVVDAEQGSSERRGLRHLDRLHRSLHTLPAELDRLTAWGERLAAVLVDGGRLLACGNGGSAAQAQHLTAELVGRYRDERQPFSAIALHADTSTLTAIANDYAADELYARQVRGHGRRGDVLVALSTSGRSPNVVAAARAARVAGLETWALTGPAPNPLLEEVDDAIAVEASDTATVQEVHQVVIHLLCAAVDDVVLGRNGQGR